jgi:alpha-tubulin suppressor-like RCC1 family protein
VRCWGSNHRGQFGQDKVDYAAGVHLLSDLDDWAASEVACGGYHSLCRLVTGEVISWGWAGEHLAGHGQAPKTAPG